MIKKYIVMSPTFSEFRAGEPVAFKIAEKIMNKWDESTRNTNSGKFEGKEFEYNPEKQIISVKLDNRPPFKFHVEVI